MAEQAATLIHCSDDRTFCFVGLWSGSAMTMVTCAPNDFMRPIHHRMPAILRDEDCAVWLDPQTSVATLQTLIAARNWEQMEAAPITRLVRDEPPAGAE